MIKISKQVEYALTLLQTLGKLEVGDFLSLRSFSDESGISFLYLQRIARSLKSADIVQAQMGSHGGYFLSRSAHNITLKEVIEAVEGPYGVVDCLREGKSCKHEHGCNVKSLFEQMNNRIVKEIEQMTIADFAV